MQITKKRLKQIIAEEMQRLNEMGFGDEWAAPPPQEGTAAHGNKDEEEFRSIVDALLGSRGISADQMKRIIDEVDAGPASEEDFGAYGERQKYDSSFPESKYQPMQEAYTRTKKRKK